MKWTRSILQAFLAGIVFSLLSTECAFVFWIGMMGWRNWLLFRDICWVPSLLVAWWLFHRRHHSLVSPKFKELLRFHVVLAFVGIFFIEIAAIGWNAEEGIMGMGFGYYRWRYVKDAELIEWARVLPRGDLKPLSEEATILMIDQAHLPNMIRQSPRRARGFCTDEDGEKGVVIRFGGNARIYIRPASGKVTASTISPL